MIGRLAVAGLLLALVAGCFARPDAPVAAAQVRAFHGSTPAVRATINARVQEDGRDPVTITVALWAGADGRLRFVVRKLDVEVLDLLLEGDGRFLAWAPRQQAVARGRLDQPGVPALLPRLRQLAAEVTEGPLPAAAGEALRWDDDGLPAVLDVEPDGRARRKTVGATAHLTLDYQDYRPYEHLQRARRVVLAGDGLAVTALLRELVPLGALDPARLRVAVPAEAHEIPIADLLEHLE